MRESFRAVPLSELVNLLCRNGGIYEEKKHVRYLRQVSHTKVRNLEQQGLGG